ncbi:hypothetical protein ROHU_025982 [Labeo rohita]|uniref:Secreted protein n=1 Tax=Labeo rohita TaxID=84645 RepID=A0A498LHU0_LABRO|nr:hypothetical protein ROHU_032099 [Labeo rohita]RXN18842.1 hypothetical protein ROHU_025982 [Labeo rohita]
MNVPASGQIESVLFLVAFVRSFVLKHCCGSFALTVSTFRLMSGRSDVVCWSEPQRSFDSVVFVCCFDSLESRYSRRKALLTF